ncbi:type II toxin-antitoxin system prevent-host-death family antitoxin [Mycobacterium intracellulare]|uniref:type II toxin-antitoxin system prevent-host-death family antitoxin n=1 Tax=Mycobacterium intracellulare TaxID=1767 RepID=UPI001EEF389D|nr:type II toxin-antitoxin system prevent-host-death family antitoxin [Mycobacterium intracellulare]MEE3755286.1 type II toxin-antitoxin system prevent-host-death family antitoxin [Mycobacterium intracellulare]
MQVDMDDLIPASELTRNTAFYVREAAAGRRVVILNNSVPKAALVSIDDLKQLVQHSDTNTPASVNPDDYLAALGIDDLDSFDPGPTWAANDDPSTPLVVPIGTNGTSAYQLNISRDHTGVIEGATEAGRTTFLDMLIVALCATYSPRRLKILLATGNGDRVRCAMLAQLPHVTVLFDDDAAKRRASELEMEASYFLESQPSYARTLLTAMQETIHGSPDRGSDEPDVLVIIDDPIWHPLSFGKQLPYFLEHGPSARLFTLLAVQTYEGQLRILQEHMSNQPCLGYEVALNDVTPTRPALTGRPPLPPIEKGEALVSTSFGTDLTRLRRFSSGPGGAGDEPKTDLLDGLAARIAACSGDV